MPYGQWWRRTRKMFHHHFHQGVVPKYHHVQLREARKLLSRLLASPEEFEDHIRLCVEQTLPTLPVPLMALFLAAHSVQRSSRRYTEWRSRARKTSS